MKLVYYFISLTLLGLFLTIYAQAGDKNTNQVQGETNWSEYERKTVGDYIYYNDYVTDENGERPFFYNKKMLIFKNDFRVGKNCLMQEHSQYGQKYREDYLYSDVEGWFCNRNGLLLDALFTPRISMLNDNCWIKVIDYKNSIWTSIDTNYINEDVGDRKSVV